MSIYFFGIESDNFKEFDKTCGEFLNYLSSITNKNVILNYKKSKNIDIKINNDSIFINGDYILYFNNLFQELNIKLSPFLDHNHYENISKFKTKLKVNKYINMYSREFNKIVNSGDFKKYDSFIVYDKKINVEFFNFYDEIYEFKNISEFYIENIKIQINDNLLTYIEARGNHPHINPENHQLCVSSHWKDLFFNYTNLKTFLVNLKVINLYNCYEMKKMYDIFFNLKNKGELIRC